MICFKAARHCAASMQREGVLMKLSRTVSALLLLGSGAFAQDIRYNFAADVNFAKFKTYKWVKIQNANQLDQIADGQLKSAFDAELAMKGLMRTENDNADLYLGYQIAINQEKEVTMYDS